MSGNEVILSPVYDIDTPVTTKDHPGYLSIVLYPTFSCNLNCYKCHNKLVTKGNTFEKLSFSKLRDKLLQAKLLGVKWVVISGGEPTLVLPLFSLIDFIKEFGLKVRIDTNGTSPKVVEKLVERVDGFAVDIKIPLHESLEDPDKVERYGKILYSVKGVNKDYIISYQENVKETLSIVSSLLEVRENSLTRTVEYPLLTCYDKVEIEFDALRFNLKHYWLEFIEVEGEDDGE